MALRTGHRHFETIHVDMTPMVDCIMVLLVFVMVSSAFVNDPGIEVQKPDVSGGATVSTPAILIAIGADNRIFFDGQELALDEVANRLRQAAVDRDTALVVRGDRTSDLGIFAAVYSEAKKAGIGKINFATVREAP